MAHARFSLLDAMKANASDTSIGLIEEAGVAHPEMTLGAARTIKGTNYKTLVRVALPAAGFRGANEGIETKRSRLVNRLIECFILDASWNMDTAVADAFEDGWAAACAIEAGGHMESAITSVCSQFYYGISSGVEGAAKGFAGLQDQHDSTNMVVNAGGSGTLGSSVWAVKWGQKYAQFVFGQEGRFTEGDIEKELITIDSKDLWAYAQQIQGYVGLQVGHSKSVAKIKNLTTATGKMLTDDMIADLLQKFPVGMRPDDLLMTPRSLGQLRNSRTATNATGAPAPFPTEAHGIPISVTESISNTETCA